MSHSRIAPKRRPTRRQIAAVAPVLESLEVRQLLAAPTLANINNQTVPANGTLQVPLVGGDTDGDKLSFSVSSNSGSVIPTLRSSNNTFLKMSVQGFGDMVFQLFNDLAPETVRNITGLVNGGYYNGLTFHRIIEDFVIQGGDKAGTGSGPSPHEFVDEFNVNAIFSGDGQLAMANSGKDTNGTQFFITREEQRHLDFNHTIWGQLIRGFDVRDAIAEVPVDDQTSRPDTPVVVSSMSIVQNKTDQVLQVKVNGTATGTVTVTVNDGHGGQAQRTFTATGSTAGTMGTNEPPILNPVGNRIIAKNSSVTFDLTAIDPEGDDFFASGQFVLQNGASGSVNGKSVTITPANNFTGQIVVKLGICTQGASTRGSTQQSQQDPFNIFDSETVFIAVGDKAVNGSGRNVDVAAGAVTPNMIVTTFTDADPAGVVADWTAKIRWGDGSNPEDGVIVKNSDGSFSVLGSHSYPTVLNFPLTVLLVGNKGATTVETGTVTARNIATLSGGKLTVENSSGKDTVSITKNSDGKIHVNLNGSIKKFTSSLVSEITVNGYAGDDNISFGATGVPKAYVLGGDGNDLISGGGGNDNLVGAAGKNTINGNGGDDRLVGSGGRDAINGGEGSDRIYGAAGDDSLDGGGGVDRLYGGDGNDVLAGGSSNDKLYGENNDDQLFGGKGIDLLDGGNGSNDQAAVDPGETPSNVEVIL